MHVKEPGKSFSGFFLTGIQEDRNLILLISNIHMADRSNNPFQFWQELKRRKVIRVIIGYLAAAYVMLELTSIIAEPFGLPDWTIKLVFVLVVAGFIVVVMLSWIFDFTQDGIKKTEPQKAMKGKIQPEHARRKLKVSDIIIGVLLVAVCILTYPRIFKKDKFKDIRDEDGRISVAVMPFENLSGDSLYNVWQGGFQNLLISTLSNSRELQVRQFQTMAAVIGQKKTVYQASITPSLARELAINLDTRTFILGKILKAGNKIRVNAQLVNAETEEVYKSYQVDWKTEADVFAMADSLSGMIRNYLEIRKLAEAYDSPVVNETVYTNSAEAFQYYIHAWDALGKMDLRTTEKWLLKAIEADSGFIDAYIFLSFSSIADGDYKLSKKWYNKAYSRRDELPVRGKLFLDHLHAYHYETSYEEIDVCKQILEMDEMNTTYWYFLGEAYFKLDQYSDAAIYWEKALDIHQKWGTSLRIPLLYIWLGDSYHQLGDHKRENEVYETGLSVLGNYTSIIRRQATCALSQGDLDKANMYINKYESAAAVWHWNEARILSGVGLMYMEANLIKEAEKQYRQALALDPGNALRLHDLAWCLIDHDIDIDEGVALAEKALEKIPDDSNMLDTRGWGLYKQGKYEEALKILKQSWELRGTYSLEIYQHIQETERAIAR